MCRIRQAEPRSHDLEVVLRRWHNVTATLTSVLTSKSSPAVSGSSASSATTRPTTGQSAPKLAWRWMSRLSSLSATVSSTRARTRAAWSAEVRAASATPLARAASCTAVAASAHTRAARVGATALYLALARGSRTDDAQAVTSRSSFGAATASAMASPIHSMTRSCSPSTPSATRKLRRRCSSSSEKSPWSSPNANGVVS
mmetsp:Transcript_52908/g.114931  ORF Transcript_52908/g.114931 Transcript_52908/m.114931 type:complete len:200 (+) Transcript_52908:929-1528(+)